MFVKKIILRASLLIVLLGVTTVAWNQKTLQDSVRKVYNRITPLENSDVIIRKDLEQTKGTVKSLNSDIEAMNKDIEDMNLDIGKVEGVAEPTRIFLSRFWIFLSAVLVFFMQAGFKALEVGMVRRRHEAGVGMKNLLDWLVLSAVFFSWGFGLMYGETIGGFIGWDFFGAKINNDDFASAFDSKADQLNLGMEFVLYQLAFAGTAATIVSGAMAERTALTSYLITALFVGGVIYPIFGHWVWGSIFVHQQLDPKEIPIQELPWLARLGFIDFAGSTVVHSVGAWTALMGCYVIGSRTGRFLPNGTVNKNKFQPNSLGYSILGVFILWFGWWGFNGGSTLKYNNDVASIVLNTNLSGAFAGMAAYAYAYIVDKANLYEKTIGGVLGGLVAITANCNVVTPTEAILIGSASGIIHNLAFDFLLKIKIDDPVGAIPVHGFCGIWGTLCVGLFGNITQINDYIHPWVTLNKLQQTGVQLIGILTAFAFVAATTYLLFMFLKNTIGLRVNPDLEESGEFNHDEYRQTEPGNN